MGWNLAGFAINKNYENKIEELSKALFKSGRSHLVEGRNKYNFEKSSTFGSTKGRMDFIFTEKGSFAFCNVMETEYILGSRNPELLQGTEMVLFAMSETSMAFMMKYYVDGIKTREIQNINGETKYAFGNPLKLESEEEDMSELFFGIVGELIGKSFDSIELDEPFTRYVKKKKPKVE
jgi:hypothetical protein